MKRALRAYFSFYNKWYYWLELLVLPAIIILLPRVLPHRIGMAFKPVYLLTYFLVVVVEDNQTMRGILSYGKPPASFFKTGAWTKEYLRHFFLLDAILKAVMLLIISMATYGCKASGVIAFCFLYILTAGITLLLRCTDEDEVWDGIFIISLTMGMLFTYLILVTGVKDMKAFLPLVLIMTVGAFWGLFRGSVKRMEEKYQ